MEIKIIKNGFSTGKDIRVDFHSVRNKQITDQECYEYQQAFGKIVADNTDNYSYLLSDLLNREDGTTHFLDKILKFLDCLRLLEASNDNLTIYNIDRSVLIGIRNYCTSKGIKVRYSVTGLALNATLNLALFCARVLRTLFRNSLLVFYAKLKLNNKIDKSITKVFISYFDYRSITGGKFTDPFFSPLQKHLQEINSPFAVVNIVMFGSFRQALNYINGIKKTGSPNITTLFNLIPLFGILITFFKLFKLKPKLKQEVFFLDNDISDLVRENLKQEFLSAGMQHTFERMYVSKLLEYKHIKVIYYPFENFAWEKFLCLEKHRLGSNIELIGFQHTSFSLKLQHHFPSGYEKTLHIYPSKILTTGQIPNNVLNRYGSFPDNVLQTGCALRHKYIFDILSNHGYSNKSTGKIAFSFSFDVSRYNYIIDKIVSIFGGKDIEVILKFHPLNKGFQPDKRGMPGNITNKTNLSWEEIMGQTDLLLYEGNSVCIDALAYNIPAVYFPFTGDIYDTNQLYNYEWDIDASDEEATYYEKVIEILKKNLKNDKEFFNYNSQYVESYFHPISKDALQRFLN
ncbi:MAG: hypothetical protein Q8K66_11585 [Sediminibacterium sp.]|nr:hypothetical protein [Sediminibacterium sp.]